MSPTFDARSSLRFGVKPASLEATGNRPRSPLSPRSRGHPEPANAASHRRREATIGGYPEGAVARGPDDNSFTRPFSVSCAVHKIGTCRAVGPGSIDLQIASLPGETHVEEDEALHGADGRLRRRFAERGPCCRSRSSRLERVDGHGLEHQAHRYRDGVPVQVITRQEIERTGKQSIQEILRDVTANGQGSIPTSFTNGFASGSAAISLRGLGVNSTLVLVNGRRMTTYGLADDGTRNFVDLNSLPLDAVERVEVAEGWRFGDLRCGRRRRRGQHHPAQELHRRNGRRHLWSAYRPQRRHRRCAGSAPMASATSTPTSTTSFVTLEASHQNNIWSKDRGFIGETDLRSKGFYDTTNGASRPYFGLGPTANSPFGVIRNPADNSRVNVIPCDPSIIDPDDGPVPLQPAHRAGNPAGYHPPQHFLARNAAVLAVADGVHGARFLQHQDEGQRHAWARTTTAASSTRPIRSIRSSFTA